MNPWGFLLYYALTFLFLASCGYVCFSVVAGLDKLGKQLFLAILAFGAFSLVGYAAIGIAMYDLHLQPDSNGRFERIINVLTYTVPGFMGSYMSLKMFKSFKRQR